MGVGAGSRVETSGEASIQRRLLLTQSAKLTVFDVGANTGQFLRLCIQALIGGAYEIHCFEPSTAAYRSLCATRNGLRVGENVVLNNIGLGCETATRLLFADQEGSELASLTKRRLAHFGINFAASETVSIRKLDDYCSSHEIASIDLLKIDVEGHELDVLKGATEMLSRRAIQYISFEFGGCNIDTRTYFQDFYYFFANHGMTIARITPSGFWFDICDYAELYEQFRTTNFVAHVASPTQGYGRSVTSAISCSRAAK